MVFGWAQELLVYQFTIIHISTNMMVYVDDITRRFGNLISHHIAIAALLRSHNQAKHPRAYAATKFSNLSNVKITETDNPSNNLPPFLTGNILHQFYQDSTTNSTIASPLDPSSQPYTKTIPIQMRPSHNLCAILPLHNYVTPDTAMDALHIPQSLEIRCLCINDVVGYY